MSDLNPHHPSPPRVVLRRVPIFSGRKKTFSQYTPLDVGRYRSKPNSPVLKISVINPPEYGNPIIFFPYLSNHSFSLTISSFYYTMSLCHSPQSPRLSLSLSAPQLWVRPSSCCCCSRTSPSGGDLVSVLISSIPLSPPACAFIQPNSPLSTPLKLIFYNYIFFYHQPTSKVKTTKRKEA
jgi:hypothetical protein